MSARVLPPPSRLAAVIAAAILAFGPNLLPVELLMAGSFGSVGLFGSAEPDELVGVVGLDGDGVGDTPHRLQDAFEYLEGSRPLLRMFLFSAASDALAAAERSFPIVPSSEEEDTAPRMKPMSGVKMTHQYGGRAGSGASSMLAGGSLFALLLCGWVSWRSRR